MRELKSRIYTKNERTKVQIPQPIQKSISFYVHTTNSGSQVIKLFFFFSYFLQWTPKSSILEIGIDWYSLVNSPSGL